MKINYKKLVLAFLICTVAILIIATFFLLNSSTIYKGVTINGIPVDGLNSIEASIYVESQLEQTLKNQKLQLVYKDYKQDIKYEDIGVAYDYFSASRKAFKLGREGNILKRLKSIFYIRFNGEDIEMELSYNNEKINSIIGVIKHNVDTESQNATIKIVKDKPIITPEVIGRVVQEELLKERIISALMHSNIVEIPITEDIPEITAELLSNITEKVSTFSTSFKGSSAGRIHNIKFAAGLIDGKLIMPGEVFSFNDITGERTLETGYKEATVIVDGEYTEGIGGGVCQVSSTLYNAVLLSDLEIVERYPHSIPAAYVSKGRDATVVDNYLDFKFKNNLEIPIYIKASVNSSNLTFDIYSKKNEEGKTVRIETKIVQEIKAEVEEIIDSSLNPGDEVVVQEGRNGFKVETYKITLYNGIEKDRKLITKDYYKPRKRIIKKGLEIMPETEKETENGGTL